jgi:hypothetical protein
VVAKVTVSVVVIKDSNRVGVKPRPGEVIKPARRRQQTVPPLMGQSGQRVLSTAYDKDRQNIGIPTIQQGRTRESSRDNAPHEEKVTPCPHVR